MAATPNPQRLTPQQIERLEQRLLEDRNRAVAQMGAFEQLGTTPETLAGELTNWPLHLADQGSDTIDQEQSFLFASREGRLLRQINEALRRLYETPEEFGRCTDCGGDIGFARLEAIPHVTTCVNCKQQWEGTDGAAEAQPSP